MKRLIKMLGATCVAALALAAMTAAGASAATFTASETGELTGTATTNHVFKPSSSSSATVSCKKAHTTGTIISTSAASQHVTVKYSECTAFGFAEAHISDATYEIYANGEADLENTVTITPTGAGCTTTVKPQTGLKSASYTSTNPATDMVMHANFSGIVSSSSGFFCPSGTTGTYTGSSTVVRVGGGWLSWDA